MSRKSFVPAIASAIVVSLSGCASSPSKDEGSGSTTTADETRTKQEGALVGAIVGGLLGTAISSGNRGKGALIGAVVGAGAGYVVGNEVAKRKRQYASEEDFLDGEIASAQELNETARQYNASLQEDIERLDGETRSLSAEYDAGRVAYGRLESERQSVQKRIETTDSVLQDLTKEHEIKVAIYEEQYKKRGADDAQVAQLEQEIGQLKENIDELNQHSQQLASIDERLSR